MDRYGYILKKNTESRRQDTRYREAELGLMTVFQLREICRREKIIQGVLNPMDKEELIRVILRFRGADEYYLIQKEEAEGLDALEQLLRTVRVRERTDTNIQCSSRITAYEGLGIGFYDGLTLPYDKHLIGTNALVVGGDGTICAILNVVAKGRETDKLYLVKAAEVPCRESGIKNYSLFCMGRKESELLYQVYYGRTWHCPEYLELYRIPLVDFEVKQPVLLSMPAAIDFGSTNTTAGVYLDSLYFEEAGLKNGERGLKENDINYALFYDTVSDYEETTLFPSVVGIHSVQAQQPEYLFGYEAIRLANSSYIDEGFCVFYDIKRWVSDYERKEEITDRQGRRMFVRRKEILRAYFNHVIAQIRDRFKCQIKEVHISCPVKQKEEFARLFKEILPEYAVEKTDMVDEGVSVLYNTISEMIQKNRVEDGKEYKALIIDCGGGTTDLCSCRFKVWDQRAAYQIRIETAYENGDTDFGGNNLTYRIMQLLKTALVHRMCKKQFLSEKTILSGYDMDVFRYVDEYGTGAVYQELEENYKKAETFLPTRFKDFENQSRSDYYKVKNNFYFLFDLAERVKKEFYNKNGTLRIVLCSEEVKENATVWLPVDKWKLSVRGENGLGIVKEFPAVSLSLYEMDLLLKADVYGIIRRFMERMYEENALEEYSNIKLTGQSCKIELFRDAIKEFVPGKIIQFRRTSGDQSKDFGLKLVCVDGALKYLRDKKYGFADITISSHEPALPYRITAYTHTGKEVVLIDRLTRNGRSGMISRNMENLTVELHLKDLTGKERYQYIYQSDPADFEAVLYEDIERKYGNHIPQADTDDIVENEVRFFVWTRPDRWAFAVVPVYGKNGELYLGKEREFSFENDGWVQNFFDGTK